jgi:hypothetical protein
MMPPRETCWTVRDGLAGCVFLRAVLRNGRGASLLTTAEAVLIADKVQGGRLCLSMSGVYRNGLSRQHVWSPWRSAIQAEELINTNGSVVQDNRIEQFRSHFRGDVTRRGEDGYENA